VPVPKLEINFPKDAGLLKSNNEFSDLLNPMDMGLSNVDSERKLNYPKMLQGLEESPAKVLKERKNVVLKSVDLRSRESVEIKSRLSRDKTLASKLKGGNLGKFMIPINEILPGSQIPGTNQVIFSPKNNPKKGVQ
jgi:hypothetical protein